VSSEKSGSTYFKGLTKRDYIKKTQEIIREEGREAASIRRIAKEMGCSSASLYRYFENQAELIYFAELNQLSGYINRLNEAQKDWKNIWQYYVGIWDCYCREAFRNPEVYDLEFRIDRMGKTQWMMLEAERKGNELVMLVDNRCVGTFIPERYTQGSQDWVKVHIGVDMYTARGIVKFAKKNYDFYNPEAKSFFSNF
jgi:AcrR family transcriptional regulator